MKILLTIAYDGTNYCGWQYQLNQPTIQATIEKSLSKSFKKDIKIEGAGRTDTGVHALGQRAAFDIETPVPVKNLPQFINARLPADIYVTHAEEAADDFHPRYDAIKKTYRYVIYNNETYNPIMRNYVEHVKQHLDFEKMSSSCSDFLGTHDFAAFCASGSSVKTTVRTIFDISMTKNNDMITLLVTGNGFLYHMVRIMAATLIDIGKGFERNIPQIILSKQRNNARKTAGANGLTLMNIEY